MQLTFLAILLVGLAEAGVRHKRITCGRKAEPNEIAWHVQVVVNGLNVVPPYSALCGGTLYNRNTVITAAHCVEDKKGCLQPNAHCWIQTGSLSLTKGSKPAQRIWVDNVVLHPNASLVTLNRKGQSLAINDVALLRLRSDVDITPASEPIPLLAEPAPRDSFLHCIISGRGVEHTPISKLVSPENYVNTTGMKDGDYPDMLRMTYKYPEFNTTICQSMYRSAYPSVNFTVSKDIELCSGFMGCSGPCYGDSGGPLACLRKGSKEYELTGVVSWVGDCGNSAAPAVYASVPHFKPWIEECTAALDRGVATADCEFVERKQTF